MPKSVERSTYVLFSSLALVLLFWQWRPMPAVIWQIGNPQIAMAVIGLSLVGWLIVLTSTFLISHFDLFGLIGLPGSSGGNARATVHHAVFLPICAPSDLSRLHPRILGGAEMTVGHLLFAAATTAYIFVGIGWRSAT